MKKIFMVAALTATSIVAAQAQNEFKPKAGDVTTDVSLFANGLFSNPTALYKGNVASGASVGTNSGSFNLNSVGVLKGRYFFQDNLALRLSLGLSAPSVKKTTEQPNNNEVEKYRSSTIYFGVGVEKHFAGTDRLSPYVGAELHLGSYSTNYEKNVTQTIGTSVKTTNTQIKTAPGFTFGGGLFMGADYYIAPKVFLGLEAGLNIDAHSLGKGTNIETVNETGKPTQTTDNSGKTKFSGSTMNTDLQVGFKIGFVF